jgi:hypothetical protein
VLYRMVAFCFTGQPSSFFEIALVFVRLNYLASAVVNVNHSPTAVVDCVSQLPDATRLTQFSRLWESARAERNSHPLIRRDA